MKEGWWNNDYYVLFDEGEVVQLTERYGIASHLPGFSVVGLKGWDDFIVRDAHHAYFVVPTVPAIPRYLASIATPIAQDDLERDPRWEGKVKWWVKPLVLGGDPKDPNNSAWISLEQHTQLVRWWNEKYHSLASARQ